MNLPKISMKFKYLIHKKNVNGTLRLLTNNMSIEVLPLTVETLHLLHTKHSEMQNAHKEVILEAPIKQVHPVMCEAFDETLMSKAALKTTCGCGSSGFGAENW